MNLFIEDAMLMASEAGLTAEIGIDDQGRWDIFVWDEDANVTMTFVVNNPKHVGPCVRRAIQAIKPDAAQTERSRLVGMARSRERLEQE